MLIFILTICIIFSGCVEENNATQSNESVYKEPENLSSASLSSEEENIPEIEITSFSSIYMHDNSENVLSYLFSWENVPGNESKNLSEYLKNDLEIDWVSNAQIIKTNDNNTIRVFTPDNSLELKLAEDKNTALITPNNIQLKVKEEDNKFCIYKVEEYYGGADPQESKLGYNLNERYYAVYELSIKNNGSNDLDFKLNKLHVRDGDQIFNTTTLDPYGFYVGSRVEILSTLEKENEIENTILSPGQTINGYVAFQVNSLYNESFLLMYNETPISSVSFEKSIEALRTTERYNYSVAFGILPYYNGGLESFEEPDLMQYPYIYSNWINRSVFEYFNKVDSESVLMSSPNDMNFTRIVYALKVIPERNITMLAGKTRFRVVDDTEEELINTSDFYGDEKIAILGNDTYKLYSRENIDIPQMNLSNATIVRTSFERYGNMDVGIICFNNQDVIMDDSQNIIIVRSSGAGFHFP
jgi:hypothetical protein